MLATQPTRARGQQEVDPIRGRRVVFGLLRGAVQVARMCRIPLTDVTDLLQMAQFRDARSQKMSLDDVAEVLGVSKRKVSQLSRRVKSNFLAADSEVELSRRIEFLLWAEPLSRARIVQAMPGEEEAEIDQVLQQLIEEERIRLIRRKRIDVYERIGKNSRLVGADDQNRLDGLSHAIGVLASSVYGRFFRSEEKALYRTISFYIRAEDLSELKALYEHIWARVQLLEDRAEDDPNALRMELCHAYAPENYLAERSGSRTLAIPARPDRLSRASR